LSRKIINGVGISFTYGIQGEKEIIKKIKTMSSKLEHNMEKILDSASASLIIDIKAKAPKDTGNYKRSIRVLEKRKLSRLIGSDVLVKSISTNKTYPLGFLLEYGTLKHDIRPVKAKLLAWTGGKYGAGLHFGKLIHHPGFLPIPHYGPAITSIKQLMPNWIITDILKTWNGVV